MPSTTSSPRTAPATSTVIGRAITRVAVAPHDALVGQIVGGLVIERVVAEGGIGVVYAARAPGAERATFAVKVLQARHAGDVGITSRFEREITFAARVAHPNVIAVRAHGHLDDGRPFFVMDLLEGMTLGALVRAEGPLALPRALAIADQILAGLASMHAARVVHRDLQPDNVFIVRAPDGTERALLIDLGFAQEPGVDTGDGVTPDSPGSLVGTLTFMSPEQAMRARAITERSDLFTTALLLYYTLSGKLPFRGGDDLDVIVSIVRTAPVPLRQHRRDAPPALDEVLARAFAKHPDARFAGAVEMRGALATVARRLPVEKVGPRSGAGRRARGGAAAPRVSSGDAQPPVKVRAESAVRARRGETVRAAAAATRAA